MLKKLLTISLLSITLLLTGCARNPVDKRDPYAKFNRIMFAFNMDMDHLLMRPIATTYNFITPRFVQTGVTNFFENINEVTSVPNDILQGKFLFMFNDFWRVIINTTFGIGGLFDVAKHMGLRPHYENFGLTLAYWEGGKQHAPYLVLPFFGPGTFRSDFGLMVDVPFSPYFLIPWDYWYYDVGLRAFHAINHRASLLEANRMIDTAFDPYIFVRSAYTQTMDKRIADNQQETFHSKRIVSTNYMTVQDFADAEGGETTDSSKTTDSGEASTGINQKKAEESGFIFDDLDEADNTAATDAKIETKTETKQ